MNDLRASRPPRVYLHVGSPKTGTTYLQDVLWSQREVAAAQGLHLPLDRFFDHFLATLDVRGLAGRKGHPPRAAGAWQRVVDAACSAPGDALISHELFAGATAEQADRAMACFPAGTEVHLVLTVRDLVRQIPAEWQEHVKHRYADSLSTFTRRLGEDTEGESWFWRVQDYPRLLRRWGRGLPPEQVHVVTVPPRGTDPAALWTRFATLLGLDPVAFDSRSATGNTSLGYEQVEVLRRLNQTLGDALPIPGPYPRVVKEVYAQQILSSRAGTALRLDDAAHEVGRRRSQEFANALRDARYDVVGDLDDLVVPSRDSPTGSLAEPTADQLLEESLHATRGLLLKLAERAPEERRYAQLREDARTHPLKFVLREAAEARPALDRVRHGFHRVRRLGRRAPGASRRSDA